jgi:hypothetical protein
MIFFSFGKSKAQNRNPFDVAGNARDPKLLQ